MKKLLIILAISVIFVGCGDPAAYKMTRKEFTEAYGKQVKELLNEQMRKSLRDAFKGDKSKDDMEKEAEDNISKKMEDITGLTFEEIKKLDTNWKQIEKDAPEGYEEMTIKQILDYK